MQRQITVTNGPWGFSTTSGSGIEGYEIAVYRFVERPGQRALMLKGCLYGKRVQTNEEATALGLEHGFLKMYSRNSCRFVMSRAARKRGHKTDDYRYNRSAAECRS